MKDSKGTRCVTLRRLTDWAADIWYEGKNLSGEPLYVWADRMTVFYVKHHPELLEKRLEMVRKLAAEYSADVDDTDDADDVDGTDDADDADKS